MEELLMLSYPMGVMPAQMLRGRELLDPQTNEPATQLLIGRMARCHEVRCEAEVRQDIRDCFGKARLVPHIMSWKALLLLLCCINAAWHAKLTSKQTSV